MMWCHPHNLIQMLLFNSLSDAILGSDTLHASDSLWPHWLQPISLLCPWNFPGKDTGVGCYFLLQGIFPNQGSNLRLLHWQVDFFFTTVSPGEPQTLWGRSKDLEHSIVLLIVLLKASSQRCVRKSSEASSLCLTSDTGRWPLLNCQVSLPVQTLTSSLI